MDSLDLLAVMISIAGTISSLMLALAALYFLRMFQVSRLEQKRALTVSVLGDYRERLVVPLQAIKEVTPDEFAMGIQLSSEKNAAKRELLNFLNALEYVSLLVRTGTIDDEISQRFFRNVLVSSFSQLLAHILAARERTGDSSLYEELEAIARRWDRHL